MKLSISFLIALMMTASGLASGVCATLCQLRVCCPVDAESKAAPPRDCCQKEPAKDECCQKKPTAKAKHCCEWIAKVKVPDQLETGKFVVPIFAMPAILPEPILLPQPPLHVVDIEQVPYEVRGPPGPTVFSTNPRGPPVARV